MAFTSEYKGRESEISTLFSDTFAASEGKAEGALIGTLTQNLMSETPMNDLFFFGLEDDGHLVGAVFMSRLTFAEDAQTVFMLAPVAVAPAKQRQGVGLALIRHALEQMKEKNTDVAVTYGDPNYYVKAGFLPVSTDALAAPVSLQYPHGWQAQSLQNSAAVKLNGPSDCVPAFRDPRYW